MFKVQCPDLAQFFLFACVPDATENSSKSCKYSSRNECTQILHIKSEILTKLIDPVLFSSCTGICFRHVFVSVGYCFTYSFCCVRLLPSIVGIYSSTLFSALTNSKYLGKEFKYETFMIPAPDIFHHLPVELSLGILASSLHPGHCMEATMTL